RFPRRRLQRLMNFGALSRGFGTCCLRFKNGVATTHAKLASGWLARLYREGVEPFGSLQKVSDHPSSFSGLGLAQGKFHLPVLSRTVTRITAIGFFLVSLAGAPYQERVAPLGKAASYSSPP